jgi:hypothetical protein
MNNKKLIALITGILMAATGAIALALHSLLTKASKQIIIKTPGQIK